MTDKLKDKIELAHSSDIYLPTRTIFLTGEITESTYEYMIKNLHALDTSPETVTIYINSEGGEVVAGMAIYNAIKAMKSLVRGFVFGEASSISSVIALACDELIMMPHSFLMLHEGTDGYVNATRSTQKKWQEFEDHQMTVIEDIYLDKIKNKYKRFGRKRLQEMLRTDTILKPKEAVKLGLADRIEDVI